MKYTAVSVVSLPAGVILGLSEQQAVARKHALQPVARRKGFYAATQSVQFKVGEVFVMDGELPKSLAEAMEPTDDQRRRHAEEKAAAERAAAERAEAERLAAEQAEAARVAAEREQRRQELQAQIATLEEALGKAETEEGKAAIQAQLDDVRLELMALE